MSTRSRALRNTALIAAVWVGLVLAWEGSYRLIGWKPYIFPAPSHIADATLGMLGIRSNFGDDVGPGWPRPPSDAPPPAKAAPSLVASPLVKAIGISAARLCIGFGASLGLGLGLGLLMWRFRFVDALVGPLFLGVQTLPSVCWVPLAVLTLGINERGILFVLVMGSFSAIAISLRDGLRSVPPLFRVAGLMLGARRYRLYRHVLLPSSLPALAGTLRQGFSFAWRSLMGAELILMVQGRGLGFLLNAGRDFADVAQVVAVMTVMVAVGMFTDRWVFAVLERRIRARFGLDAAR